MKKLALLFVLFLSVTAYSKEVPSPFWYSISEKILAGTHQLISTDDNTTVKSKLKSVKKVYPVRVPLKCEQKKGEILPTPFLTIKSNKVWTESTIE